MRGRRIRGRAPRRQMRLGGNGSEHLWSSVGTERWRVRERSSRVYAAAIAETRASRGTIVHALFGCDPPATSFAADASTHRSFRAARLVVRALVLGVRAATRRYRLVHRGDAR